LQERYEDDPLAHPKIDPVLWLKVGSSGGPDRNRVYGISNTTTKDLPTTQSVSVVGCL
jgi:hypothetical protein